MLLAVLSDYLTVNSGYAKVRPCYLVKCCLHFNPTKTTPYRCMAISSHLSQSREGGGSLVKAEDDRLTISVQTI